MTTTLRTLAAAAALVVAIPAVAYAADRATAPAPQIEKTKERAEFPMAGDAFVAKVEARLAKAEQHMEHRLEKSKLDDAQKARVREAFAKAASRVRAAANDAAADGSVTKDEAKAVRKVAKQMKKNAQGKKGNGKKGGKKGGRKNKKA
jgi:hypothetical protein